MKHIITIIAMLAATAANAQWSVMGGMSKFEKPHDGIYWNHNQHYEMDMTPPAGAIRYDWTRWAIQYTWFGEVKTDGWAVSEDAPRPGGYIEGTGGCVGTCAELWRWKMQSETQSIAVLYKWPFENGFTFEAGVNLFEIRVKGHFEYPYRSPSENGINTYNEGRYLDVGPVVGLSYRSGDWSMHWQVWRMEGHVNNGRNGAADTPPNWHEKYQQTFLLARRF